MSSEEVIGDAVSPSAPGQAVLHSRTHQELLLRSALTSTEHSFEFQLAAMIAFHAVHGLIPPGIVSFPLRCGHASFAG